MSTNTLVPQYKAEDDCGAWQRVEQAETLPSYIYFKVELDSNKLSLQLKSVILCALVIASLLRIVQCAHQAQDPAMAFAIGKGLTAPLMLVNFCLYFITACLAGSILNRNLDANVGRNDDVQIGNTVTVVFIPIALIASMVGLASVLAGAHHVRIWRSESLAAAGATSLIAWLLTLLAMGIACKEIHTGYGRSKRLKTLEAFMIILSLFELLYLLTLQAGSVSSEGHTPAPVTPKAVKDPNFGTPAATAV